MPGAAPGKSLRLRFVHLRCLLSVMTLHYTRAGTGRQFPPDLANVGWAPFIFLHGSAGHNPEHLKTCKVANELINP
jgi:hypothetical protein